jgi:cytochrome b561
VARGAAERKAMEAATSYGAVARFFHWLTVALLLTIIPIGLVMGDLPRGPLQDTLFVTHESLGLTVLGLTLFRLFWRLTHRPPPPSRDLRPLEERRCPCTTLCHPSGDAGHRLSFRHL